MDDLLSRTPTPVLPILEVRCANYDTWKDQYATDHDFQEICVALNSPTVVNQTPLLAYTIRDGWLYKLNLLLFTHSYDHLFLIKEAHASSYGGHFGTTKTLQHLQHHFYWPSMQPQVEKFIRACALCSQLKPSNRKHVLYQPLPLPSHPWESISMDLLRGLPTTQKKHDAIWVVVCHFRKWIFSFHAQRILQQHKQQNCISNMYGHILSYQATSFHIETHTSSTHFGRPYRHYWGVN
jgi:hypothetical protein